MHPPRCAARRAREARNEYRGRVAACAAMQQRRVPQIERRGRAPCMVSHYRLGVAFLPYSCYRARGWCMAPRHGGESDSRRSAQSEPDGNEHGRVAGTPRRA